MIFFDRYFLVFILNQNNLYQCIACLTSVNAAQLQWSRWRHQMETFSASLAICTGNSPISGEFPAQRPVTRSFDVFFDLRPNKRLSKQWRGWWFETPSRSLWRHCDDAGQMWMHFKVATRYYCQTKSTDSNPTCRLNMDTLSAPLWRTSDRALMVSLMVASVSRWTISPVDCDFRGHHAHVTPLQWRRTIL